jgi:hypothetical protein
MTDSPPPPISPFGLLRSNADDPPNITRLRYAVMGMAAILALGFVTVIGRILYLVTRPPTQADIMAPALPSKLAQPLALQAQLLLPAGARVRSQSISGQLLSVHYESPAGEGIIIVDLSSGREVSRVRISTSP